jgi:DNA primase
VKSQVTKDDKIKLLHMFGSGKIQDLGHELRCACPLHGGDNPTAFTWNDNGLWFCFTGDCGGGDVFDFVANKFDMSIEHEFKDVVRKTAELLEIDIKNMEFGERTSQQAKELKAFIEFVLKKKLSVNPVYDLSKLGETRPLNSYRHYTKETIEHFNASYNISMNRIQVPLYDHKGNCIGASLRRVDEAEEAKWLHRPKHVNTKHILYGMPIRNSYAGILVEGAFDAWSLYQIGIAEDPLGTLGAHLSDEQAELIIKNYVEITTAFDNDKAGRNATRQAIIKLQFNTNLRHLELGELHDPGDITSREQLFAMPKLTTFQWIVKYGMEEK